MFHGILMSIKFLLADTLKAILYKIVSNLIVGRIVF